MSGNTTAIALGMVSAVVEGDGVRVGTTAVLLSTQAGATGELPGAATLHPGSFAGA